MRAAIVLLILLAACASPAPAANESNASDLPAGFCGSSSMGACGSDDGCLLGGCSGQVCQSASEPVMVSTCEYRDCYNAGAFGLGCKCVAGTCKWTK